LSGRFLDRLEVPDLQCFPEAGTAILLAAPVVELGGNVETPLYYVEIGKLEITPTYGLYSQRYLKNFYGHFIYHTTA
jgi:hypothetical protein